VERVFGEPWYRDLKWWDTARALAAGVARVESQTGVGVGTGFLAQGVDLRPDLPALVFITADFVIDASDQPMSARFSSGPFEVCTVARELFRDTELHVALLELDGYPEGIAPLPMAEWDPSSSAAEGAELLVLGHPRGLEDVQISLGGQVLGFDPPLLRYHANTEPGSSGSPVVLSTPGGLHLVAMHFARRRESSLGYDVCEGTLMPEFARC
jgi:hypothetical protein